VSEKPPVAESAQDEPRFIASSWARKWLLVGGVVLAIALAYALRRVLVPLLLAFLLAYALDPLVDRLQRLRVPRSLAAVVVVLGLLVVLTGVLVLAVPVIVQQFAEATSDIPEKALRLRRKVEPWIWSTFHYKIPATPGELALKAVEAARARGLDVLDSVGKALFSTLNAIVLSLGMLIIPVFTIYLLIDFDAVVARTARLVPRRFSPTVYAVAKEVHVTLGRYVRGQILANLVLASLYATGLWLVGAPLGVPLGVLTGIFAFVPYVGFGVGFVVTLALTVLEWQGPWQVVGVIGVMGTVQLLDAFLVTPRIVGGAVGLKPIEVLLTMMAAGTLFGFLGVLLAVPIGAVIKIVVAHAVAAYYASDWYRQRPPPPAELTPTPSMPPSNPP
jgi:predicted PurR-regulated permease PerM